MFGSQRLLGTLISSGLGRSAQQPDPAAGAPAAGGGGMIGALLGGGAPGAAGSGLGQAASLAMLGTLAYKAYQSYQQARPEPQAQTPIAATPRRAAAPAASAADELSETDAQILIRAMVAAANADGHVDADEAARIRRKLQQSGAGDDELRFVAQEIRAPASVDVLVREARDPEMASHIYAASLLGMGEYTRANQTYLAYLATRLRLDPATIAQLHRQLGVPPLPAS